ncbi:hypothetical protein D3C85_13750 [compost metagenome]
MSELNPIEGDLMPDEPEYIRKPPFEISESVDPLDVIRTTQSIRIAMVKQELQTGLPNIDKDSRDFTQLLRDLDSAALTTRKIDVEERQVDESQRLANAQNELLKMLGGKNPFAVELTAGPQPPRIQRDDPSALPPPVLVPDITVQGTQSVNYETYVQSIEESERQMRDGDDD